VLILPRQPALRSCYHRVGFLGIWRRKDSAANSECGAIRRYSPAHSNQQIDILFDKALTESTTKLSPPAQVTNQCELHNLVSSILCFKQYCVLPTQNAAMSHVKDACEWRQYTGRSTATFSTEHKHMRLYYDMSSEPPHTRASSMKRSFLSAIVTC